MGIAPDIVENLIRPGERPLRVDNPLGVVGRRQITPECRRLMQVTMRGEEPQLAGCERLVQVAQEQSPKQARQHLDRKKDPRRHRIQLLPSGAIPPPGTRKCRCGWWLSACPHVCNTARNPISAPRCWGSAAMVRNVSDAARNRISYTTV